MAYFELIRRIPIGKIEAEVVGLVDRLPKEGINCLF